MARSLFDFTSCTLHDPSFQVLLPHRARSPASSTSQGRSTSFTRPPRLSFVAPSLRRVTQSTSSSPSRQPPPFNFFSNFLGGGPALNSGNLPHLARTVNPSIQTFLTTRRARHRSRGSHTTYNPQAHPSTPRRTRQPLGSCGANSIISPNGSVKGLQRIDRSG